MAPGVLGISPAPAQNLPTQLATRTSELLVMFHAHTGRPDPPREGSPRAARPSDFADAGPQLLAHPAGFQITAGVVAGSQDQPPAPHSSRPFPALSIPGEQLSEE